MLCLFQLEYAPTYIDFRSFSTLTTRYLTTSLSPHVPSLTSPYRHVMWRNVKSARASAAEKKWIFAIEVTPRTWKLADVHSIVSLTIYYDMGIFHRLFHLYLAISSICFILENPPILSSQWGHSISDVVCLSYIPSLNNNHRNSYHQYQNNHIT